MLDDRLSFEEFGILLALAASSRSEDIFTQVGGAAFDKDKRIIAVCYNGFLPKMQLSEEFLSNRELKNQYVFHSEQNLLAQIKKGDAETIFLTHSPCANCARLIAANDVKNVFFLQEYHRETGYKDIFNFYGVKHSMITKEQLSKVKTFLQNAIPLLSAITTPATSPFPEIFINKSSI